MKERVGESFMKPIDEYINIYKDGKLDMDTIFEKINSAGEFRDFVLPKSYYENNIFYQ